MNLADNSMPWIDKKRIFLFLACYFILHLLFRLYVSNSAELDEAEQLLLTQDLRLGYGSQPPVYTWLLSGLFPLLGGKLFALAFLKNSLLFLTYLFLYLSGKEMTGDDNRALTAMLSLFLVPQILWESQRDLTHSVLGTTVAACSLFLMLRLLKTSRLRYYILFGLVAGLGVLSKYNYVVFLVALFLGGCSLETLRPRLLNRKMLLGLLFLLLVVSPHLYWTATNLDATLSAAGKFRVGRSPGLFGSYALGVKSLLKAVVYFLWPLLAVYALFFRGWERGDGHDSEPGAYATLVARTLCAGMLVCLLMVLFFKVTAFKDRWMQPLLFATPLYLAALPRGRFTRANVRRYAALTLLIAVGVLLVLPGRTLWADHGGKVNRLNSPYAALAAQLRQAGFRGGQIMAQGRLLGGNLKLFFPAAAIQAPEVPLFAPSPETDRLIVWDASKRDEIPEELAAFAGKLTASDPGRLAARYVQAPYRYAPGRSMRLGFILLRGAPGGTSLPAATDTPFVR